MRTFASFLKVNSLLVKRDKCEQDGFTLVEMVGVLVIMAILALVAVPRFVDRDAVDVRAFQGQALNMLRFAQKIAIAQNRAVYVRLSGSRIAFCFNNENCDVTAANRVPAPAGRNSGSTDTLNNCDNDATWFCEALPGGVTSAIAATDFYFNGLGAPFNAADTQPNSTFTGRLDFPLTGGGLTRLIHIEANTGYVHL
jgi:MSHA pilin protein MshC